MFARPRPKKQLLTPLPKKRKVAHAIEEIPFDHDARAEYLTGFHKRKLQRIKRAQEEAAKQAQEEKVETKKQLREERKREVQEHVEQVEALLREADRAGGIDGQEESAEDDGEWEGLPDATTALEPVDHEEEYIDEDKYTTVTVESVSVSRDGLARHEDETAGNDQDDAKRIAAEAQVVAKPGKPTHPPKKKKPKFRYETKSERQVTRRKEKMKKRG